MGVNRLDTRRAAGLRGWRVFSVARGSVQQHELVELQHGMNLDDRVVGRTVMAASVFKPAARPHAARPRAMHATKIRGRQSDQGLG